MNLYDNHNLLFVNRPLMRHREGRSLPKLISSSCRKLCTRRKQGVWKVPEYSTAYIEYKYVLCVEYARGPFDCIIGPHCHGKKAGGANMCLYLFALLTRRKLEISKAGFVLQSLKFCIYIKKKLSPFNSFESRIAVFLREENSATPSTLRIK